jgi:SNF2 family DNA or RNA helicase
VVRQPDKEEDFYDLLENLHFEPYKNAYIMKDEKYIYEFLTDKINDLMNECELYYSEAFKGITIRKPGNLTTNLTSKTESNFFDFSFEYEDIPKDELKDLMHSYRLKKKYYRMKNGSFVDLNDKNLENIADILEYLNLTSKDIKDGNLTLPKQNALYLNSALKENEDLAVIRNQEFSQFVDKITNPSTTSYDVPDDIHATLRSYQVTGYKWLRTLADNNLGGILADDMGLGKTLQSIVYIAGKVLSRKEDEGKVNKPFLVVCPTSLVYNWQEEINNFAPFLRADVVSGTPEQRQEIINNYKNLDVLITSYPLIRRDSEFYEQIEFDTMFIDEAQFIKNANSQNAKSVKTVNSEHKFALTGTPIENTLSELWSIFDFIMPFYLLSHTKFMNRYEKPIVKGEDQSALNDLLQHISPFILRRMKKEVLNELPEKVETKMLTDLTDPQKKVYMSYLENIRTEISSEIKTNGFEKSKMKILAALTRLRQICCHPSTFIENYKGGSGKLELLMEIIPDAIANGHRVLIFSQFTSMLDIIEGVFKEQGITYFSLSGSTPMDVRADYVKRFNNGENSVFLISLKAGGTGLNLTGADTVIHYDPWWNPAVEEQATDRVYRIGQTKSVQVIRLITKGTIEEKIFKLQQSKKALSESVIQSKEVFINKLSKEELEDIFS